MGLIGYKPYSDDEIESAIRGAVENGHIDIIESLMVELASRDLERATLLMDVMKGAIAARKLSKR